MNRPRPHGKRAPRPLTRLALTLALCAVPAPLWAQEEGPPEEEAVPLPDVRPTQRTGGNDLEKELVELFGKVERNLIGVDVKLSDAGAGEAVLEGVPDAGLDDLLREANRQAKEAQAQMDRILELAAMLDQNQSQGSGSGSRPKPDGSPLDSAESGAPQQPESTPEAPRPGEEEQQQDPQDQQPGGQQPEDGPREDQGGGENRPGTPPEDQPGSQVHHDVEADKWGFLPPRQRETFRNQGRDDLPVQYRQWIDNYYRRLNQGRP